MVAMNSIPQHEVANGRGQSEFFLAMPTTESKAVAKKPGPSMPAGAGKLVSTIYNSLLSKRFGSRFCFSKSIPIEDALLNDVVKTAQQYAHKNKHFYEPKPT